MPGKNAVDKMIFELGEMLGVDEMVTEGGNYRSLLFDEELGVDFDYNEESDRLYISSLIATPESLQSGQALYENLLRFNNDYMDNGGIFMALDENDNIALMSAIDAGQLSLPILEAILENHVNHVEQWNQELVEMESSESQNETKDSDLLDMNTMA